MQKKKENVFDRLSKPRKDYTQKKSDIGMFTKVPINDLNLIFEFCSNSYVSLYRLSLSCRQFYVIIQNNAGLYMTLLKYYERKVEPKLQIHKKYESNFENTEQIVKEIRSATIAYCQQNQIKIYDTFRQEWKKLFNYNSTKENLINKLIERMKFSATLQINQKPIKDLMFKLYKANYSSRIVAKIQETSEFEFNKTDELDIKICFKSGFLNKKITFRKIYNCKEVIKNCKKQRVYNFQLDENFVLCFFDGDKYFLYCLFEISVISLLEIIYQKLLKISPKNVSSSNQKSKQIQQNSSIFDSFVEYIKYQTDFEIFFCIHNSTVTSIQYNNTKIYPIDIYSDQAYFEIEIQEKISKEQSFMLDNKQGIAEKINDLTLLDLTLKDRDNYLILFSGFIYFDIVNKTTIQNNMKLLNDQTIVKSLNYQTKDYSFEIIIINDQEKKNQTLHKLCITLYNNTFNK